jgi:molybdopterin-guanine dinucleotide biosynthesis protein A
VTAGLPAVAPAAVTALVLAGGAATRMGGSKAERRIGDRSLLERSLGVADAVADEVLLLPGVRPLPDAARGRRLVADWSPQQKLGPLAALGAGLEAARNRWCLLLPCDMPWLSAGVALRLIGRAERTDRDIVAVREASGWQPFLALYRSALASHVRAELASGRRSLVGLIERSAALAIAPDELADLDPELRCLRNVNTPAELAAAVLAEAG